MQKKQSVNNRMHANLIECNPSSSDKSTKVTPNKEALVLSSIFIIVGVIWAIIFSISLSPKMKTTYDSYKIQFFLYWFYVLASSVVIFIIVRKRSAILQRSVHELKQADKKQQLLNNTLLTVQKELLDAKKNNEKIFMEAHVIIGAWDNKGRIIRLNPFGEQVFGYTQAEYLNKQWSQLFVSDENRKNLINNFARIKSGQDDKNHETIFMAKDKRSLNIIWNNSYLSYQNKSEEILSIGTVINDRKELEEKLRTIAYFDNLTGLPSRVLLEEKITKLIAENTLFTFVHLSLDNFKQINNMLGHSIGDQFLQYISSKFCANIAEPHIVARLTGDEFAIVFVQITSKSQIEKAISRLNQTIGKSWELCGHEFFVSFSNGVASFPKDASDCNSLFKNSSMAMHRAKKEGKSRNIFYSQEILQENIEGIELANQLKYALEKEELVLYYQPQFDIASGNITGLEALVRWIHPEKGFIPPAKFIPIAEETGQIYEIEKWIFETALKQKKLFEQEGNRDISISINLSSKSLSSERNFRVLEQLLSSYDVDYSHITIEITETAIISDIGFAVDRLKHLREFGIKIALDDFGTGYSSLIYLKDLPIDIVKLDRNFIKSIEEASKAAMIIKAILYLTLDLNYEVVAEGIETLAQLEYLKKHKCQTGQGYLMSKPIPIDAVDAKLKSGFLSSN